MHMAAACNSDGYDAWLSANSAFCNRLSARITLETCLKQQEKSVADQGDLRCSGCNGLHDQLSPPQPRLVSVSIESGTAVEPATNEFEAVIAHTLPAAPEITTDESVDLSGLSLDISPDIATQILVQNPELAKGLLEMQAGEDEFDPECTEPADGKEEHPAEIQVRGYLPEKPLRVAVYRGRCIRCGGYMINALERHDGIHDDDVYRCFCCGWRTSPVYETNRRNPGLVLPWGG